MTEADIEFIVNFFDAPANDGLTHVEFVSGGAETVVACAGNDVAKVAKVKPGSFPGMARHH